MRKTVLVSGAAGFIAGHLIKRLLAEGHEVIGVDNFNNFYDREIKYDNCAEYFDRSKVVDLANSILSPYRHFQEASPETIYSGFATTSLNFLEYENYTLYGMDLCDYANLRKVFEKHNITHIVNIAALAGVRPSVLKPVLYQKNNGESTANLCDLAAEFDVKKFVHASSSSVYGARSKVPFSENEDISKPISPYAASKVADEARLHAFHHLTKIPTVALRFFTVYGPRQRPDLAITKFTKLIDEGKPLEVYGDGSFKRDFTYIDDIMDGVTKAMDLDCAYEIFNLGESQTTDVNTLIGLIETALDKKAKILYTDPVAGDVPITFADITKAKEVLGYNPQTKIEEGIAKFVAWFRGRNKAGIQ